MRSATSSSSEGWTPALKPEVLAADSSLPTLPLPVSLSPLSLAIYFFFFFNNRGEEEIDQK